MPKKKSKRKKLRNEKQGGDKKIAAAVAHSGVQKARLIFPVDMRSAGFTSAGISRFNDKDIPSAVRELIQNSLDAAMEIKREKAIVRFFVESCPLDDIPGISDYKRSFMKAQEAWQDDKDGQTADIIDSIGAALQKERSPILFVEDNGVGLDVDRMEAVLGDGVSIKKGDDSIGNYGNGHLTIFYLSQLRYILYGGVSKTTGLISSAHAILASHKGDDGKRLSNDGFYAVNISDEYDRKKDFPGVEESGVLKNKMEKIRQESGSGTVVAIPAFNNFGKNESDSIADDIKKAAALNFFPAIYEGKLEIQIVENSETTALTKINLQECIQQHIDEKVPPKSGFPFGMKVARCYQTLTNTESLSADIGDGQVRIFIQEGVTGSTRVTLFRNGMWVTDRVAELHKNKFTDKVSFDALVLVGARDSGKLHNLMGKAEEQLHIGININGRLHKKEDKRALRKMLVDICDFISEKVPDSEKEKFEPSYFYRIESGESIVGSRQSLSEGEAKDIPGGSGKKTGNKGKKRKTPIKKKRLTRPGKSIPARIMSRPCGSDEVEMCVVFGEDCAKSELRLAVDNGVDPSCTGWLERTRLYIRNASLNGENLNLVTDDSGKSIGINMLKAQDGERRIFRVAFEPGQLNASAPRTILCEFFRRATRSAKEQSTTNTAE